MLFISFIGINCLFEDQSGTYDWRQQHVGRPIFSHIDFNTKKFYAATDQNLLSALNIKTGNIAWRKIFESNAYGKVNYVLWGSAEIVVITGNGQKVQSFDYNNGFANWEYVLFNRNELQDKKFVGIESKKEAETFYFIDGKQICYVGFKEKICVDMPLDGGYFYETLYETSKGVFVVGYKENSVQRIQFTFTLSSIVSKSVSPHNGNLKWISSNTQCLKSSDSDHMVCMSSEDNKLYVQKTHDQMIFEEFSLPKNMPSDALLVWASNEKYVFEINDRASKKLVILARDGQQLKAIHTIDASNYNIKTKNNEFFLVYAKYSNSNELSFTVINLTNSAKSEHVVKVISSDQDEPRAVLQLNANLVETKSGQFGIFTFCFFNDYTMSIFNTQGIRYFTREEALAYISSVEMVDFPQSHLQEEFEEEFGSQQSNIISMFIKRIRTQIAQLKEFVCVDLYQKLVNLINSSNPNKRSPNTKTETSPLSVEEITRDAFNLNKIIVVATTVGKVYGIYTSANGEILWSFYLKDTVPFQLNQVYDKKAVTLFLQRTSAHLPHEPQAVFIGKYETSNGLKTRVFFFNPLTGKAVKDFPKGLVLDYDIRQAFLSPVADSTFLKALVLFDKENKLHVFPESATNLIKKAKKLNVIYTIETSNNKDTLMIGYAMTYDKKPSTELWRIDIKDETVQTIGVKNTHDRIHSHGKVLGDRSILYKYLNPNIISVVTAGQDSQKLPFVNVYLIDTVTGSVVNSFSHKRCKGPVNIVHSENWFFYSYYNMKNRRYEVTSVELFEGSKQFNSTSFSSFDDIKPIFYSKSYVVQKAFSSIQVTQTEKGITTKDVIVACQSGVILDIPWVLIDPRRPMKMTEVEKEENLMPYLPEIPLNYEFSLNYYNYVYNIKGITTASSGLESTSLVFAYGLDIFFTRVFPSKTFDLLREDFDYLFVSTLVFGLLIGTFLSKKLASSSNLKKAWK